MVSPNEDLDPNNRSINLEISEKAAEGVYSNLVLVAHSPSEFVIDFARILPGPPKGQVHTRIIMTPAHAKSLLAALQDNLSKFERNFGPIQPLPQAGPSGRF